MKKVWLIIIGAVVLLVIIGKYLPKGETTYAPVPNDALSASISFSGTQFIITNKGNVDWTDVKFTVNDDYTYHTARIAAGTVYTLGAMQFSNSDGLRFNPYERKPKEVKITAIEGWYSGKWD